MQPRDKRFPVSIPCCVHSYVYTLTSCTQLCNPTTVKGPNSRLEGIHTCLGHILTLRVETKQHIKLRTQWATKWKTKSQTGRKVTKWETKWNKLGGKIGDKVKDKVRDTVGDKVGDKAGDKLGDKGGDKVEDKLGDEVGDKSGRQSGRPAEKQIVRQSEGQSGRQSGRQGSPCLQKLKPNSFCGWDLTKSHANSAAEAGFAFLFYNSPKVMEHVQVTPELLHRYALGCCVAAWSVPAHNGLSSLILGPSNVWYVCDSSDSAHLWSHRCIWPFRCALDTWSPRNYRRMP
jgi:hypothetical protein